jgi:hypothetical protein
MEFDLESLFGLLCTAVLIAWEPATPLFPRIWAYIRGCTDKKENQIFLLYKEIQNRAVAKSYMTNGLPIYGEILAYFLVY